MAYLFKRGRRYYLKFYVNGRQKEKALRTDSYQLARELQRKFESGLVQGLPDPLPTRTPATEVLTAYVRHLRSTKKTNSVSTDINYLRRVFRVVCPKLGYTPAFRAYANKHRFTPGSGRKRTGTPPCTGTTTRGAIGGREPR